MSYILDALRKSEHERQMATGQSVGMLYPIEIKRNHKPWLILTLLVLTALITSALIWWIGSRPIVTEASIEVSKINDSVVVNRKPLPPSIPEGTTSHSTRLQKDSSQVAGYPPQVERSKTLLPPGEGSEGGKETVANYGNVNNKIDKPAITVVSRSQTNSEEALPEPIIKPEKLIPESAQKKIRILPPTDTRKTPPARAVTPPSTTAVINTAVNADPLKELPALNITGYIHNEQSGSLAMINNQLVHEGEEVSPGLRLVKILDDSVIFSYKGYVFSR